jgi:hypothetical protein
MQIVPQQPKPNQCPRQELNLVPDLRRVVCESVTLRGREEKPRNRKIASSRVELRPELSVDHWAGANASSMVVELGNLVDARWNIESRPAGRLEHSPAFEIIMSL